MHPEGVPPFLSPERCATHTRVDDRGNDRFPGALPLADEFDPVGVGRGKSANNDQATS